ncbi:MAG: hypothetical protein M3O72_03110 [Verrucomicrobiota bacterium]|nr:hypothetical protein [Verrucomicrobiota bacterium]
MTPDEQQDEQFYRDTQSVAFPKLDDRQLSLLEIERDEKGFIKTGTLVANAPAWKENKRPPGPLETSLPAIFAAGDVRSGSVKRCAAAVGEGGMAVAGVQTALAASAERS